MEIHLVHLTNSYSTFQTSPNSFINKSFSTNYKVWVMKKFSDKHHQKSFGWHCQVSNCKAPNTIASLCMGVCNMYCSSNTLLKIDDPNQKITLSHLEKKLCGLQHMKATFYIWQWIHLWQVRKTSLFKGTTTMLFIKVFVISLSIMDSLSYGKQTNKVILKV